MDEENIVTAETETEIDPFDEGWGDVPTSPTVEEEDDFLADEPEAEEDQPSEDEAEEEQTEEAAEPAEETKEEEQTTELFELKYMGETQQRTKEDTIALAQKGMDYDRIRSERDTLKSERAQLASYKQFLEELAAPSGQTIEELMDATRARVYSNQQKAAGKPVSDVEAIQYVQRERAKAVTQADAENDTDTDSGYAEQTKQVAIKAFVAKYGSTVDPKSIPAKVWDEGFRTGDLVTAYENHQERESIKAENAKLKERLEAAEQNLKNKERSTGSRASVGKAIPRDDFDSAWDSWKP